MSNKLREIRKKDSTLKSLPEVSLEETRKTVIPRHKLSSAYERKRNVMSESYDSIKESSKTTFPGNSSIDRQFYFSNEDVADEAQEPSTHLYSQKFSEMGNARQIKGSEWSEVVITPSSRDGVRIQKHYFVDSLTDICTRTIASTFHKNPIDLESAIQNPNLRKQIVDNLSVHIPLQVSVEKIHDDSYWKRCCEMRWTNGQIGSFLKSDPKDFFTISNHGIASNTSNTMDSEKEKSILAQLQIPCLSNISSPASQQIVSLPRPTTWKQLYLEQNLQEFLESTQSEQSIIQELHILSTYIESENNTTSSNSNIVKDYQSEVNRMRKVVTEREQMRQQDLQEDTPNKNPKKKKNLKENDLSSNTESLNNSYAQAGAEEADTFSSNEATPESPSEALPIFDAPKRDLSNFELHSNRMKPNLFYYLLHVDPIYLPTQIFREKLMNIFDGAESIHNSRLSNISNDDDIFTFYDNAVYRSYYKNHNHKNQYAFKNIQFWLQAKDRNIDENPEITAILEFVKEENLRHLQSLCSLSNKYVRTLEIRSFRAHIDLATVLQALPNLTHLQLSYRVLNAGMSFQIEMCGMKTEDIASLSNALSDSTIAPNLTYLNLSENMIDDVLLTNLVAGLKNNRTIRFLDLSHNKISGESLDTLHEYLSTSQVLLGGLDLSDNQITRLGARYIGEALVKNTTLTHLDLKLNRFEDDGGASFLEALKLNKTLTHLNISHNQLGAKSLKVLEEILPTSSLISLDISGNPLKEGCGPIILSTLKAHPSLMHVDCRKTGVQAGDLNKIHILLQQRHLKREI